MAYIQIEIEDEVKVRFQKKILDEKKTIREKVIELIEDYLKAGKRGQK